MKSFILFEVNYQKNIIISRESILINFFLYLNFINKIFFYK